jgi:hypothetical protein
MVGLEGPGRWGLVRSQVIQGMDKFKSRHEFLIGPGRSGPHDAALFGAFTQEKLHNLARLDLAAQTESNPRPRKINRRRVLDEVLTARTGPQYRGGRECHPLLSSNILMTC